MKLTLEPTDRLETFEGAPCRIWTGLTDSGVEVVAFVRSISPQTHDEEKLSVFDRELKALPPIRREWVSFDYRMVAD
ncbi:MULTISPECIES: hypothetical protein [Methylosinus]|uniref:Uncharacterized protein n=1 Tax=Methylosinus trichosporium (strain ATCC 35070 / NCIMB 11131 / UNIQEM 75 / OB3b) TaxID=595536 RepID=A0A2D2CYG2_METT3|nr:MULTISPECIES: hypothetical protein [Methylosinus]ATQ67767.1 hypothetical protein CQW49_07570 [Methylosinus trichosporium OB3b]OBS51786.1 hypothetical protein A8B73_14075 [Methylosinus sp. 3S-1]